MVTTIDDSRREEQGKRNAKINERAIGSSKIGEADGKAKGEGRENEVNQKTFESETCRRRSSSTSDYIEFNVRPKVIKLIKHIFMIVVLDVVLVLHSF